MIRINEQIKVVPKGWGEERWLHNDQLYCGKILVLRQGKHCSLHYHKRKTETFYLQQGKLKLELTDLEHAEQAPPVVLEVHELSEGDAILLMPGMVHRFTGIAPETLIFEFSTEHFDEDSHRIVPGD